MDGNLTALIHIEYVKKKKKKPNLKEYIMRIKYMLDATLD